MIVIKITKNITNVNHTIYKNRKIEYLVIHYFGALSTAEANTRYFKDVKRGASAHYFVDERGVWQCVEDANASWHCGDKGSGEYKGVCRNSNSIGIELRPLKINKRSTGSADRDWYFDERTIENTIELVKFLMAKYKIPLDKVIRHYDVTAKWCPRPFVGNDINAYYNRTGNQMWADFKRQLIKGDDKVTQREFNKMMDVYLKELNAKEPSDWSKNERVWAESLGIIEGNNGQMAYRGYVTREQMVTFLKRLYDLLIIRP